MIRTLLLSILALLLTTSTAADWPQTPEQTVREEWYLYDPTTATRVHGPTVRAYACGAADTSAKGIQIAFSPVALGSYYISANQMRNGNAIRSGRYDIYNVSAIPHVLLRASAWIHGHHAAAGVVDDTSLAVGAVGSRELKDRGIQSSDIGLQQIGSEQLGNLSVTNTKLGLGSVAGVNLSDYLRHTGLHARFRGVVGDSLTLGTVSTPGTLVQHDGLGCTIKPLPSPSMTTNTTWYWPIATGNESGIYQRTATGAQITLSPSGLTSLGATTITATTANMTKLAVSGYSAPDTSYVRGQLRVGRQVNLGGYGYAGKLLWHRNGYTLTDQCPDLASGDGSFARTWPNTQGNQYDIMQSEGGGVCGWTSTPRLNSLALYDGSGHTFTLLSGSMLVSRTATMPIGTPTAGWTIETDAAGKWSYARRGGVNMLSGSAAYTDISGWYRQAFAIAGMTANHIASGSIQHDRVFDGTIAGSVTPLFKCKNDSLIISFSSSPGAARTIAWWAWIP